LQLKNFSKALAIALLAAFLPISAHGNPHDSGANGNTIVFSDYAGSPTTFSAIAGNTTFNFQCFASSGPQLPETIMTVKVGPIAGAGSVNLSSGGVSSRFVISWLQASTSTAVTFSPRFASYQVIANSQPQFQLTTNYTTFSLQVAAADTVTLSYEAPVAGGNDILAAPSNGGAATLDNKPMSFSNLTITPSNIPSRNFAGACFPRVQVSGGGGSVAVPAGTSSPTPIKYAGPEFSGLSLKPVLSGTGTTLEGRKLDQISSITIDGKAAKLSDATDKSLKLELPAGLKPGVYDLVVNTANHGKLTHMNAIRIREELPATSLTIKGTGVLSGEEFKKLTAFSRTQNPDMNKVTCIVNSNSEGKSFMQARALCDRIAANNLNIKTTMFENRSTVEGSAIFARVVFSSEE
jgi:hypothetical protein